MACLASYTCRVELEDRFVDPRVRVEIVEILEMIHTVFNSSSTGDLVLVEAIDLGFSQDRQRYHDY